MDSLEVFYHKYEFKSPCNLLKVSDLDPMNFEYNAFKAFNAYVCKCKQFYSTCSIMLSTKTKSSNSFIKLTADFKLSNPEELFSYRFPSETYVWPFLCRMLNLILFTSNKVFKRG